MSSTLEVIKRQYKSYIEKIKEPSGCCQACLSETLNQGVIVTCTICQSSIHSNHYGHQLSGPIKFQGEWKCQRCKFLIQKNFKVEVKCKFCPSLRGIIKKIKLNSNQIWVHPQCSTWCYPIIFQFANNKRIIYSQQYPSTLTSKFWCRIQKQKQSKCQICSLSQGYKIKCCFYSCQKFYHATCAKKIGVIRDLESMKFQKADQYCPPYCQTHLEMKVLDCANRIKLYTQNNQHEKVALFTQIHNGYRIQLKNLHMFVKKFKQQEQMRNQLGKQMLVQNCQQSSMSLSISGRSLLSDHPSQFYAFLQNKINSEQLQRIIQEKEKQARKNQTKMIMSYKKDIIRQDNKLKNFPGISSYSNCQQSSYANNQNQEGFQQYKFHQSGSSSQSVMVQEGKERRVKQQNLNMDDEQEVQIQEERKQDMLLEQEQYQYEFNQINKLRTQFVEVNSYQNQVGKHIHSKKQIIKDQIYDGQSNSQQIQQKEVKQLCQQDQNEIHNLNLRLNIQNQHQSSPLNLKQSAVKKQSSKVKFNAKIKPQSKYRKKSFQEDQSQQEQMQEQQQFIPQNESESEHCKQITKLKNINQQLYDDIDNQQYQSLYQEKKQSNSEYSQLYESKGQKIYTLSAENIAKTQKNYINKQKEQPLQQYFPDNYKVHVKQDSQYTNQKSQINIEKNERVRQKRKTQKIIRKQNKNKKKVLKKKSLSKLQSSSSPEQQSEDELYELDQEESED